MDYEKYYGPGNYRQLLIAESMLRSIAYDLQNENKSQEIQPIINYSTRIKSPESMINKLIDRGFDSSAESALSNVFDAVGLRIVCSFESDVYNIVKKLEDNDKIEIILKKDYLAYPKPNGYRSIHLCIRLAEKNVLAEIQVRTIAMEFWATLEHQIKYKKNVRNEKLVQAELKRCADEIASIDISMQIIRDLLQKP